MVLVMGIKPYMDNMVDYIGCSIYNLFIYVMAAEVKKCTCKHEGQDKLYGAGNRLMNEYSKGYRCTVCGKTIDTGGKK